MILEELMTINKPGDIETHQQDDEVVDSTNRVPRHLRQLLVIIRLIIIIIFIMTVKLGK